MANTTSGLYYERTTTKKVAKKKVTKKEKVDSKKYFSEVKNVGDRIEVKSHSGRVMDFKDLDSAIDWAKDSL